MPTKYGEITKIVASGEDVYFLGSSNGNTYWLNGNAVNLEGQFASVDIAIEDDIFVVATELSGTTNLTGREYAV